MCSGSSQVEQSDLALQQAQTSMTQTLDQNYQTAFSEQQNILAQQQARLNNIYANPSGYSQPELANMTTQINENAATAGRQAAGAAAAAAARGGATDVGSGAGAQIAGSVMPVIAASKASSLANLATQNAALKRANQWKALAGLQDVGAAYGGAAGTGAGSSAGVAESGVGAGSGALAAGNEGFEDVLGAVNAAGGIAADIGTMGLSSAAPSVASPSDFGPSPDQPGFPG